MLADTHLVMLASQSPDIYRDLEWFAPAHAGVNEPGCPGWSTFGQTKGDRHMIGFPRLPQSQKSIKLMNVTIIYIHLSYCFISSNQFCQVESNGLAVNDIK